VPSSCSIWCPAATASGFAAAIMSCCVETAFFGVQPDSSGALGWATANALATKNRGENQAASRAPHPNLHSHRFYRTRARRLREVGSPRLDGPAKTACYAPHSIACLTA
jgi:hypothetical protein